jgi:rhamnose utilization protein RhaD (predicted bifunctional aldolase and dehydrogenase)
VKINALSNLITISHAVGERPELIQGGGGNTSVKSPDGTMFIKASGTPLKGMTEDLGYAVVKQATGQLLGPTPEARPSMELPMHLHLPTVVIHTHAVYANVFNCMANGNEQLAQLFFKEHPLFIPYHTPGDILAAAIDTALRDYNKNHHTAPKIIFLQNHGLITCADDVDTALQLTLYVSTTLQQHLQQHVTNFKLFSVPDFFETPAPSQCLFPDAAVFTDSKTVTPSQQEIFAANAYIIQTIKQLQHSVQALPPAEIVHLQQMESEQYRLQKSQSN